MALFGGAGHSQAIAEHLSKNGLLIGIDKDTEALKAAKKRLSCFTNVMLVHGNHDHIVSILQELQIQAVDGILLDLGVSSYQLDEAERGFSYMQEAALDMRMDRAATLTAADVVNTYSEEKLADILWKYGEEKFSKTIARKIVECRNNKTLNTTKELTEIICKAIPGFAQKEGHPAKRTFQAIRIEVNNEIEPLYNTIRACIHALKPQGRLCVITFHSLEDRAVKQAFQDAQGKCNCPPDLPYCVCGYQTEGKIMTKKAIVPTKEEMIANARSKSAKLRIFAKC